MYNVFLMLDDDFVKVAERLSKNEAQSLCDKLNNLNVEPLYYIKPMKH